MMLTSRLRTLRVQCIEIPGDITPANFNFAYILRRRTINLVNGANQDGGVSLFGVDDTHLDLSAIGAVPPQKNIGDQYSSYEGYSSLASFGYAGTPDESLRAAPPATGTLCNGIALNMCFKNIQNNGNYYTILYSKSDAETDICKEYTDSVWLLDNATNQPSDSILDNGRQIYRMDIIPRY